MATEHERRWGCELRFVQRVAAAVKRYEFYDEYANDEYDEADDGPWVSFDEADAELAARDKRIGELEAILAQLIRDLSNRGPLLSWEMDAINEARVLLKGGK